MLVERRLTSPFEDRESALISRRYGVPGFFILLLYWNWCSYRLEMGVSGNLWIVLKDVKTLVVYDVEWEAAMDSMKGKCASSWVDLGYTNQFCVPKVTSVIFSSCDSPVGDSLEFNQANRGSLCVSLGKRNCTGHNAGKRASSYGEGKVSLVFSSCGRNLGYILELERGCPFETLVCSLNSGSCLGMRDNSGM